MNQKQIVFFALSLSLLCCAYSQDINITIQDLVIYNKWKISNKRIYINEEEQIFRQVVFFENLKAINQHNSNPYNTYTVGINQFSDLTEEEFISKILNNGLSQEQGLQSSSPNTQQGVKLSANFQQAPSIDWRIKGAVTPIKNQGQCGSCWSFSAVALMESVNFIKYGKTTDLSEQQLVDCVNPQNGFLSNGCNGGQPSQALKYAAKFGVVDEKQYPYVGKLGECKITSTTSGFKPKTVVRVKQSSEDIKNALNNSPVIVAIDASKWYSYKSGIFNDCGDRVNHAVLAVGYDIEGNWIIKNSWAASWGENGYIKLAAGNTCNIIANPYYITA